MVIWEMHCKQREQIYIQSNVYSNKKKVLCPACWKRSEIINLSPGSRLILQEMGCHNGVLCWSLLLSKGVFTNDSSKMALG